MIGLGTIVNTLAVIVGGIVGTFFGSKISKPLQDMLMKAIGVAVVFVGIVGVLQHMLVVNDGSLGTQGTMLLIFSLVIGGFLGELIGIEKRVEQFGAWIKKKINRKDDAGFVDGFVNTSLIVCVGAMGIVGSIEDGLTGDPSLLFAKALLDAVIVIVTASVFGIGAAFSAIPLLIWQGGITVIAWLAGDFISPTLLADLSMVGAALIFCVGINLVWGDKIKVGNLLPALLVPIVYDIVIALF